MDNLSIFDLLPEEEAKRFRPIKSSDWKWSMANDYPKEKNGLKVFSCFACGGGSTMGYKLAGCEVLGCVEIDPRMNEVYIKNHHPKHNFLMDIREFNNIPNEELPPELFDLDILDGSPPCTTFSMAGDREDSWGKKKKFREGQAEQTLDDLSFVFIDTVAKLKPKVMIMENVEGLIRGEAWSYVQKIYQQLIHSGYKVKHWLLKGQHMGVPQTRHRVFFVAIRNDIDFDLEWMDMSFNYEPIVFGTVKEGVGAEPSEKESRFNEKIVYDGEISQTLTSHGFYRGTDKCKFSNEDYINVSTFPSDYDYKGSNICYITCMSVPPVMIKRIVTRLIENGLFDYKKKEQEQAR